MSKFGVVLSQGRESGEHVWRTVLSHDRDDVVHRVIVFREGARDTTATVVKA